MGEKIFFTFFITAIIFFSAGWILRTKTNFSDSRIIEPIKQVIEKPLEKYEIESLRNSSFPPGNITQEIIKEEEKYTSYKFIFEYEPGLDGKTKKTSGIINIPKKTNKSPLVLLIRGYVDQGIYQSGVGTKNSGIYFVENGFITVAPDFLGYAESDSESTNIFESRFQTYTTVIILLSSLDQIDNWDKENIFIWAHSNGGQIALTTLAVTGKNIPSTLFAPVTKPFPYSVLYYTDESNDGGKYIRKELAQFESLYDVSKFSYTNYLDYIKAPLQIHQGGADDAVPQAWSKSIVQRLENQKVDVTYFVYPNADHNVKPGWDTAIQRSHQFFLENLK